jgi:hypothetical protein
MKTILITFSILFLSLNTIARKYDIAISPCSYINSQTFCFNDPYWGYLVNKNIVVLTGDTILFRVFNDNHWIGNVDLQINGTYVAGMSSIPKLSSNSGSGVLPGIGYTIYEVVASSTFSYAMQFARLNIYSTWDYLYCSGTVYVKPATPDLSATQLEASYNFDGNANDISLNGHDGILLGATATTDRFGNAAGALNFSGSQYVDFLDGVYMPDSCFSLAFWFKLNSVNNSVDIIQFNGSSNDLRIGFAGNNIVKLTFGTLSSMRTSAGIITSINSLNLNTNPLPLNSWNHIVVTGQKPPRNPSVNPGSTLPYAWGGPYYSVYLNGGIVYQSSITHAQARMESSYSLPKNYFIGAGAADFFQTSLSPIIGGNGFDGAVDDMSIWKKELSYAEVQMLYNNVTGINETVKNTISISPNPTKDVLNITGNGIETIKVYDISGRMVLQKTYNKTNNVVLDVKNLSKGLYQVIVNNNAPIKIIKE